MAYPHGYSGRFFLNRETHYILIMKYTAVNFTITPFSEDVADALIAELGNLNYDGFQYTENGFTAYIPTQEFQPDLLERLELLQLLPQTYRIEKNWETIEDRDWNKEWEENFTPIRIGDRILVRAGFHETVPGIEYEIIIEPKMSFGTGHHATTALMLETILDFAEEIQGKTILDMGCGTAILSIMAAKTGAKNILGIDIDDWAFRNAMENIRTNHLDNIRIKIGDAGLLEQEKNFDVILANINRNILLNDMQHYITHLSPQGLLIMSGFYTQDLLLIREKAEQLGLLYRSHKTRENWVAVSFYKK